MPRHRAVSVSKFLARHLRHAPERLGIVLAPGGWAEIDELLAGAARAGFPLTRDELDAAVHAPGKRRYAYDEDGLRIRAVQGHSVPVDLGLAPASPPAVLFHGTHAGAVDAILREGLRPMERTHVHLSPDVPAAVQVGRRRGRPVVLRVDAARLHAAGHVFLHAENGVWLTGPIPADRLAVEGAG